MTRSASLHDLRQQSAAQTLKSLGPSPSNYTLLAVHCAQAHHVATVYTTPAGPLYASHRRPHSHGDRDRHDAAHHGGHRDDLWLDWLAPDGGIGGVGGVSLDDPLPAGCECGARSLSRARLLAAVEAGERRIVID